MDICAAFQTSTRQYGSKVLDGPMLGVRYLEVERAVQAVGDPRPYGGSLGSQMVLEIDSESHRSD